VSFVDAGRTTGGAHLGLQWYDRHPGGTAVNWGGYRTGSGELDGEASRLPSATGNPNTRDFPWRARVGYRLCIRGDGDGWWTGEVTDTTTGQQTVVRRLRGGGTALARPVVWSEVFARCDDPRTAVRWSELQPPPAGVRVTYQAQADGGCANTAVVHEGDSYLQITNAPRPDR
jgi:hypothetical protein